MPWELIYTSERVHTRLGFNALFHRVWSNAEPQMNTSKIATGKRLAFGSDRVEISEQCRARVALIRESLVPLFDLSGRWLPTDDA